MPDPNGNLYPDEIAQLEYGANQQAIQQAQQKQAESTYEGGESPSPPEAVEQAQYDINRAVIAQKAMADAGFTPPEGAKPVEFAASAMPGSKEVDKAKPTVFERNGERYYSPFSTMWAKGYKKESEYRQPYGEAYEGEIPPPFVAIKTGEGLPRHMTRADAQKAETLTDRQQFNFLQDKGVISKEMMYIPGEEGDYGYLPKETVYEIERYNPELMRILTTEGMEAYKKAARELKARIEAGESLNLQATGEEVEGFNASNTRLPDGKYMSNVDLAKVSRNTPQLYKVLTQQGYDAYLEAYNKAQITLKPYEDKEGKVNLDEALLTRKPEVRQALSMLVKKEVIDDARYRLLPKLTVGEPAPSKVNTALTVAQAGISAVMIPAKQYPPAAVAAMAVLGIVLATKNILDSFQKSKGRPANLSDIVVVTKDGKAMSGVELAQKYGTQLIPPTVTHKGKTEVLPAYLKTGTELKAHNISKFQEGIRQANIDVAFLPTPQVTEKEALRRRAGLIVAERATATAENNLRTKTKTIEIDYEKVLEEAQKVKHKADIDATASAILADVDRYRQMSEVDSFKRAYKNYLMRRLALDQAKRQYVEAMNPQPIKGKATEATLQAYYNYILKGATKTKTSTKITTQPKLAEQVKTALKEATQLKQATKIKLATQTRTATKTATKVATKAAVRPAELTRTAARTAELTRATERAVPITAEAAKTAELADVLPIKPIKLSQPSQPDEEKRQVIKDAGGAISWPQGELHGEKVWHTIIAPFRPRDHVIVVGTAPEGADLFPGPREAYRNLFQRGTGPQQPVTLEGGAIDPTVSPGPRISFVVDKTNRPRKRRAINKTVPVLAPKIVETRRRGQRVRHLELM